MTTIDRCGYDRGMFGSHLSIAGGLVNALEKARAYGFDCVQVFTKNQRQWKAPPLRDAERDAWLGKLREMKWTTADEIGRTVSHNSYLVNLASPDRAVREKSVAMQREELRRCAALDIPFLVAHPGAHLGRSRPPGSPNPLREAPSKDELAGLKRIVRALDRLHRDLPGYRTITCLETTVGSGTNLGYDFAHLRFIRDSVREPERIAFCFDTCHVTAAGYDMTTDARAEAVLEEWDAICGLETLRVVHANDSAGAVGSRRDRHAHIGAGACGLECFRAVVNHPRLRRVPKVLETPKEDTAEGTPWDIVNVRKLKRLSAPAVVSR